MGYEYKIVAKLTENQIAEIKNLLISNIMFDKKYEFDSKMFWDFRHSENRGKMPNISVVFENDGIYICQYGSSYLWTYLDKLKDYILNEKIEIKIIDYQD